LTPLPSQTGTTTVTVTVSDGAGTASTSFVLTVGSANQPPTISDVPDQLATEDAPGPAVPFTVADVDTPLNALALTASSNDPLLLPNANLVLGGAGASRTIAFTPAPNRSGVAIVTVTVSDGVGSATDTFRVTVSAVNDAPTISPVGDQVIAEGGTTPAVPFTVGDVETLAAAALVAKHGASWYRSRGTAKSTGTKVFSVSGDCERPGIYEFPFGVTVKQVLDEAGARDTQAVQVGGPAGALLGPPELGRRLCYEELSGSGSIMVFDTRRDMLDVVVNFARFFAHESCGFCTPCRVGTTLLKRSVDALAGGKGTRKDLKDALRISRLLKDSSHCGLGHSAGNPLSELHAKFKPSIERRLSTLEAQPTFDLDEALAPARALTGRDDAQAHLEDA